MKLDSLSYLDSAVGDIVYIFSTTWLAVKDDFHLLNKKERVCDMIL